MYSNIALWIGFGVVTLLLGGLTLRAWRVKNALLKWGGVILSGLLTLLLGAISVTALIGLINFYAPRTAPIPAVQVAGTPEQIARGEYLANSFCTACHAVNGEFPLTGGVDLGGDLPLPLGTFVSANLTPAGPLKDWSDGEIFRALRSGVDREARGLLFMSIVRVRNMSDDDLHAIIAYLRSQPPVPNATQDPLDQPSFLAAVMSGANLLPAGQPPVEGVITAPPQGPTVEYGEYILSYQDCRDCHGEDLRGGVEGQLPPVGPNLRVVQGWTREQFITTLRTGVDPNHHALSEQMPWRALGRMTDDDLTAMYQYLLSLP